MSATATPIETQLELDHRSGDGLEVWLFWAERTNRLFVLVNDAKMDEYFEFDVEHDEALDAFRHPYAYAAFRRVRHVADDQLAA
jgi:hypothetical protein